MVEIKGNACNHHWLPVGLVDPFALLLEQFVFFAYVVLDVREQMVLGNLLMFQVLLNHLCYLGEAFLHEAAIAADFAVLESLFGLGEVHEVIDVDQVRVGIQVILNDFCSLQLTDFLELLELA